MKSQRSIYTLPISNDVSVIQDVEGSTVVSSYNNLFCHDPSWPHFIAPEPEPLIPCYLYQYPLFQISCEQFQSLISVCQPNLPINSYENNYYFTECLPESYSYMSTTLISDSGYSENYLAEGYQCEELVIQEPQEQVQEASGSYPIVTKYGAVSIMLRHLVRVEISAHGAVYLNIAPADCIAAVNEDGNKSCVIHPNGRVFHDDSEIHMSTLNRKAKICKKGVIFTSTDLCLSYLVDESGTKTTAERFRDLSQDFSFQVFYNDAQLGDSIEKSFKMVDSSSHKTFKNGDEVWIIGGFRIKQDQWGDVKVTRSNDHRVLRASPTNGQVTIKTESIEISVGRYPNHYLFVRKDSELVSASLRGFNVQCGTQKAGINNFGKVVLH